MRVEVPFDGPGAGEGPLTWGQQQCWRAMVATRSSLPMGAVMRLPGLGVDDYVGALRFWMGRYASLRTRLRFGPDSTEDGATDSAGPDGAGPDGAGGGRPVQVVAASGEAFIEIVDAGDPETTAQELLAEWRARPFDYEREWPVRLAVVRKDGTVTHAVMVVCHLAADAASIEVMNRELVTPDPGPYAGPQPLELAAQQAGSQRPSTLSLRYWETHLRAVPQRRFPPPQHRDGARYRRLRWDSPALHAAVQGAPDQGAVLLAAFALAMGEVTGVNPLVTQVIVGNRFRPGLADVVSPLTQNGLCVLDVAGADLAEATRRAVRASMAASKNAYYSPDDWLVLLARYPDVELGVLWNDRRMRSDGPADPTPAGEEPMDFFNEQLMVNLEDVPGTVRITAEVDTRHLSMPDLRAVLELMERTVTGRRSRGC